MLLLFVFRRHIWRVKTVILSLKYSSSHFSGHVYQVKIIRGVGVPGIYLTTFPLDVAVSYISPYSTVT